MSDLVTNQMLDAKLGALEHRLLGEMATLRAEMTTEMANLRTDMTGEFRDYANRLILWFVPTIFAGITGLGVAAGLLS